MILDKKKFNNIFEVINMEEKDFICRKCNIKIGGKSYYIIESDCIYDGKNN